MAKIGESKPSSIEWRTVVPIADMRGDDDEDTKLLQKDFSTSKSFLLSHDWCFAISSAYFGIGVGGIFSIFLIEVDGDCDDWLWVVEGDLPSAYLVIDQASNPRQALRVYLQLMRQWIMAVRGQCRFDDAYPVDAEPTEENARQLESRLEYLETEFL